MSVDDRAIVSVREDLPLSKVPGKNACWLWHGHCSLSDPASCWRFGVTATDCVAPRDRADPVAVEAAVFYQPACDDPGLGPSASRTGGVGATDAPVVGETVFAALLAERMRSFVGARCAWPFRHGRSRPCRTSGGGRGRCA